MTKFFIDQHGCAKNQVDGEILITHLKSLQMEQTFDPEEADYIIVNSCGFIESAKKESIQAVYYAKEEYPNAKIILAGCLSERYAQNFYENIPEIDGIFGNGDLSKITQVIQDIKNNKRSLVKEEQNQVCFADRKTFLSFRGSAFVKITEGCSNYCSFCAIPLIRGNLRSRSYTEIVEEIKELISNGVVEINLIGQDLAAYGTGSTDNIFGTGSTLLPKVSEDGFILETKEESGLALLLKKISQIEGNFVVRLLYIHPDHFNTDILFVIKDDKRFLHYFDIPFQSGDDGIIKSMNRKGSVKGYLDLINKIKNVLPDAVIRTTFLTGFPGETIENAKNTEIFLNKLQSQWSGCFSYSKEEDTAAYLMKKQVSHKEAEKRALRLQEIQKEITINSLKKYVGQELDVLIEEIIEGEDGLAIGRAWFQAPDVDGSVVVSYEKDEEKVNSLVIPGRFIKAKIVASNDVDLDGIFVKDSENNTNAINSDYIYAPEIQNK